MTEEKWKEIYDACTPENQEKWNIMTSFFHFQSMNVAKAEADKNRNTDNCVVIYAETSLSEFV